MAKSEAWESIRSTVAYGHMEVCPGCGDCDSAIDQETDELYSAVWAEAVFDTQSD